MITQKGFVQVIIILEIFTKESLKLKINAAPPVSFKMRLSNDLQEKLKKEEFQNSDDKFQRYKKLFKSVYPGTEDTTILNAKKNERGDYELYVSTELAPGSQYFVELLKKPKNLAKSLLLLCNKNVEIAEKRLFRNIIKEKVSNYENPRDIRAISDKFEKNKAEKKEFFDSILETELEIRDNLTRMGGGLYY